MSKYNILKNVKKSDVILEPFPHVVIDNAIDEDLYESLSKNFPSPEHIMDVAYSHSKRYKPHDNNCIFQLKNADIVNNSCVSKEWKEFTKYHSSEEFHKVVLDLFGKDLVYKNRGNLIENNKIKLSSAIRINSRVTETCTVRAPHVDAQNTLYVALLYMRHDEDGSEGGKLVIYQHKNTKKFQLSKFKLSQVAGRTYMSSNEVDPETINEVKVVPYAKNRLLFFLNSDQAVHGVTDRKPTNHYRRLINVIAKI